MADQVVKLDRREKARLARLKVALQAELGIKTDQKEIVAALVYGSTLGDVAGMVVVYNRYTAALESGTVPDWLEPPPIP